MSESRTIDDLQPELADFEMRLLPILATALRRGLTPLPHEPAHERCHGKACSRKAEYEVRPYRRHDTVSGGDLEIGERAAWGLHHESTGLTSQRLDVIKDRWPRFGWSVARDLSHMTLVSLGALR